MYLHCFPSSFCSLALPQPLNRCRRHRLTDLVDIDLPTSTTSIWRLWKCSDRGCGKADLEAASFQPLVSCLSSHAFTTSSMVMPKRRRRRRNSGNSCLRNSCLRAMRFYGGHQACWAAVSQRVVSNGLSNQPCWQKRKMMVVASAENGQLYAVGNITGANNMLTFRSGAGESTDIRLIINARVECSPEHLDELVRQALLNVIQGRFTEEVLAWRFLQPGRPNPSHRFSEVVKN